MDCTFKTDDGKFNFRVGALIKDEKNDADNGKCGDSMDANVVNCANCVRGRILMVRNPAERPNVWYSVGGRVQYGETLEEAVLRELKEETGLTCEVERLCAIHENFFTANDGTPYHEISGDFLVKMTDELRAIKTGQLTTGGPKGEYLEWIDLNDLAGKTIFPNFFTTVDFSKETGVLHFIKRGDDTEFLAK